MSINFYVPNNHIISELPCHGNLLTSPKTAPLCLRQVLVVRMSIIQISFFAGDLSLPCGMAFSRLGPTSKFWLLEIKHIYL